MKAGTVRVAGVDATHGGWVAVILEDGRFAGDAHLRPIDGDFGELADCSVIAIDIPIGYGPRLADAAARTFLRGAPSTVFTTPTRKQLEAPFGPGLGVSAQAHALGPRIIHVTSLAVTDKRFYETHPEVSFETMNGGARLGFRKKSFGGMEERRALLAAAGIDLSGLGDSRAVPVDDVLDVGEVALHLAKVVDINRLSCEDGLRKKKQRHVRPAVGAVDREEP